MHFKDKDGKTIIGLEGQLNCWTEDFEEQPTTPNPPEIQPADLSLPNYCKKLNMGGIRKAIVKLKNGKAAGGDTIPGE